MAELRAHETVHSLATLMRDVADQIKKLRRNTDTHKSPALVMQFRILLEKADAPTRTEFSGITEKKI